ncbi:MAG: peptide-methionine (S)-S-oxide reductase MsrA [Patescibacteria group bacterium]
MNKEEIIFGGGCFWCTGAVFKMLKGVISVLPGYAGGQKENPTYKEVSEGNTGHAEVIKIKFDSSKISFRDLLTVFFATHDPTTINRQGSDVGTQYRSIILYTNDIQKKEAEEFMEEIDSSATSGSKVVTEVKPLIKFYEAEDYHKDYYAKNSVMPYCQVIINPKLEKVQREFRKLISQ